MTIDLASAERILAAAKARAEALGVKVGLSIVDPRGDLKAAVRMDGAPWRVILISQGKAFAAAAFGVPSGDLAERANSAVMRALMEMEGGRVIPTQGAIPIRRDDEVLGAIGVSGAPTSEQDEDIAIAGASAF